MSDSEARNWMSCLGWGCLTVVVLTVLGIGGCVAFVFNEGKGAHTVAKTYLAAVDEGRYEVAFATLGTDFAESRGLDEFTAFEEAARAEFGDCGEWKTRGTTFNREDGRSVSSLTFHGECENGSVTASLALEEIDGTWVVQDIRYNEPVGPVVMQCAGCGEVVPQGAKYCPECGAGIGSEQEESGEPETPSGDGE